MTPPKSLLSVSSRYTVFSVLAAEAPGEAIAVYRFPAINMCRYKELINHAVNAGVRVMNISMGSNNIDDWTCFATAAQNSPSILFVVSAGNNGRNIDEHPVYPAALSLDNLFVVSSSDHFGRPGSFNTGSSMSISLSLLNKYPLPITEACAPLQVELAMQRRV